MEPRYEEWKRDSACRLPSTRSIYFLLKELSGCPDSMSVLAAKSYWHPLGFLKVILPFDSDSEVLRLHYWPGGSVVAEDIHSHRSHFTSRVLSGIISSDSYELTEGEAFSLVAYEYGSDGDVRATRIGSTGACRLESNTYCAGQSYFAKAFDLHRVSVSAEGAVTISLWHPGSVTALVLKPGSPSIDECCMRGGCSVEQLKAALADIFLRIESGDNWAR